MEQGNEILQVAQQLCQCWFAQRDVEATAALFADDVCFWGTGGQEHARGITQMRAYLSQDIAAICAPFTYDFVPIYQHRLSDTLCSISFWLTLNSTLYAWRLRMLLMLRREPDGCWRITELSAAEPSKNQQENEHYPDALVISKIAQARQQLLSDSLAGGMMGGYIAPGFPFYFINHRMLEHLGYATEADFVADIGGLVNNCMHPDDRAQVDAEVDRQLAEGDEYAVEYRMKKRDGSYIWIHDIGRKLRAENGRDAIISVCVDITETRRLQTQMQQKYEQEIAYFAELSSAEGNIQGRLNVTQNRVETYSAPPDVSVGQVGESYDSAIAALADSAIEETDKAALRAALARRQVAENFAAGKVDYHFSFLRTRADGHLFWCRTNMRASQNPETGDLMLFFYTQDATEQHLQRELLNHLVERDYDNIIEVDLNSGTHRFISYKPHAAAKLPDEVNFAEAVRIKAETALQGEAQQEYLSKMDLDNMRRLLQENDTYSFTVEAQEIKGAMRVKRYQVFYISRELNRVCITRSDVTDVVRREQRQREELSVALLAAEQANAAKTNFLSRMSHEIRTPMNAIIGMAAIAAQAVGDDATVADCLSKIGISSRFLLSLINDILDMSRIESGKLLLKNEELPTEEFINGLNAICYGQAEGKGVEYECLVDPLLDDYYMGDSMKLQQVLVNILSNAIKFTPSGGTVTLAVQQRSRKKESALLRFVVNDTGIGISEEFLPHLFEPFTQESSGTTSLYGGTGLGLAISKNIIDLMGGKISVRSIKGVGTEFTVDVSLGLSAHEKSHRPRRKDLPNFASLKTLVVDDDVVVCESAIITLKEMGICAEWVDSGQKAIEQVQKLWTSGVFYDLILIDWKMPEMDGIETARRIRAIVGSEVTIIIMTAYDWNSIEHEAKQAGVNLLMSKPMFKSSLVSAFTRALGDKDEPQPEKPTDFDFTGKRVLLAEDNAINTEVATKLLTNKGFAVECAKNGLRAMELFSKSAPGYYDAILMDIRMPLMDGLTAASSIRHLSNPDARTIPIIAMTANAFDDDVDKSKAAGMNAHLAKPIDPQRLYQTLYDFVCAPSAGQEE